MKKPRDTYDAGFFFPPLIWNNIFVALNNKNKQEIFPKCTIVDQNVETYTVPQKTKTIWTYHRQEKQCTHTINPTLWGKKSPTKDIKCFSPCLTN